MNRKVVCFHLQEAAEQLNEMVERFESKAKYSAEEFEMDTGHLYHHLNTAWNGQNQTDAQHRKCDPSDFAKFRKFPKEREFIYLRSLRSIS